MVTLYIFTLSFAHVCTTFLNMQIAMSNSLRIDEETHMAQNKMEALQGLLLQLLTHGFCFNLSICQSVCPFLSSLMAI